MSPTRWLRLGAVVLAAILLYVAFRGADWAELGAVIGRARGDVLAAAVAPALLSLSLRATRWRLLLRADRGVPWSSVFWATAFGYMGNAYLPARAGDLLRSLLLGQRLGLAKSYVLGTTAVDRAADAGVVVAIALVAVPLATAVPDWLAGAAASLAGAVAVALLTLHQAPRFERWTMAALARLPIGDRWIQWLGSALGHFIVGSRAIGSPGGAAAFVGLSLLGWMTDAALMVVLAMALGLDIGYGQAVVFIAALALASAVPATPGYIGIYQFVAVTVLTPFGLSQAEALAQILVFQALLYGLVTSLGLIGLWRLGWFSRVR
ncbi:MAG: lysylphosphatidylglycerol synthase transmembrane domain-containing protein [Alphaproteobacteria bacterium]|jgi:hypothetical protein|nr:lysylphosphatidylglycerol synthase transmembrane domain-containing protein [Alphaproteobacteria bacterium]